MTERILPLDGLRGGAALFVFAYHLQIAFGATQGLSRGYLMVDLFFLLSGFVICRAADPKLAKGGGALPFLVARALRIWPVMAVGVLVGLVAELYTMWPAYLNLHGFRLLAQLLISSLLLIPYFAQHRSGALFPLNGPHWSLMFELAANVLHALVLWRLRNAALAMVVGVWAVLLIASCYFNGGSVAGPFWGDWYYGLPRVGFSYSLGMLMARLWTPESTAQMRFPWFLAQLLPVAATVAMVFLPFATWLGDTILVIVIFPACLWVAAGTHVPPRAAVWLSALGALSYPLYAIHGPIIWAARHSPTPSLFVLVTLGCLAAAAAVAALLERGPWPDKRRALAGTFIRAIRVGGSRA